MPGPSSTPNVASYVGSSADDGIIMGATILNKIGFYGAVPVVRRTSSNQATTNMVVSASFGAQQVAICQEIMNTFAGLGLWTGN